MNNNAIAMKEFSRESDSKNTTHIRLQETYQGYDVIGADVVLHAQSRASLAATTNSTMNGIMYQDLNADLANAAPALFTEAQAQKALQYGIHLYQQQVNDAAEMSGQESQLMVLPGKDNKAHWVYRVQFRVEPISANKKPVEQIYIMDAATFQVYESWDDMQTLVDGGGFGGNPKMGQRVYDGLIDHLPKLIMTRNDNTCLLQNQGVTVTDINTRKIMSFPCHAPDENHNNVYWNAAFDTANKAYSPSNDAFFSGQMVKEMYENWYGIPVLASSDGKAVMLNLLVHKGRYDGAVWDARNQVMIFGDGYTNFYPLTSLDVAAHEMSHAFTGQHSRLLYFGQSGAMNESFSDIAANAAEAYAYGEGKNSWKIGAGITKAENKAIRYLDKPSHDCEGRTPGNLCSIDNANQYVNGLDVHYASGVYNRFFYTLATTPGWNVRKAFDVMVYANRYYWTSASTFSEGACNVISAAKHLGDDVDVDAVKKSFDVVKVNYRNC
jgi:pseudolysin